MLSVMKRLARVWSCFWVKLRSGKAVFAFSTSCLTLRLCSQRQHARFWYALHALPFPPSVAYAARISSESRVLLHFSQPNNTLGLGLGLGLGFGFGFGFGLGLGLGLG